MHRWLALALLLTHYIVKQGSPTPGVNGWGIDLRHRISLGVASADSVPALRAHLERLGVPCRLVIIENIGPGRSRRAVD